MKFISSANLNWSQIIKGDKENNDYPAEVFYDDFLNILNRVGFLRNLTRAEVPIADIIPESNSFAKQTVDFYIPLLKTIIEVDGFQHIANKEQAVLDQDRDRFFKRNGYKVLRIHTRDIKTKNYEDFLHEFRNIYRENREAIDFYQSFLERERESFQTQITLTAIARFQVLILEMLDRGTLSFDHKRWNFDIVTDLDPSCFELAVKDLELWLSNVASLFNITIDMPHINIQTYQEQLHFKHNKKTINIVFDLFKRWDETDIYSNAFHIKTDYDDYANYFSLKTSDPIVYSLDPEHHKDNLSFLVENLFGYQTFNDGQLEIIINCLNGEDTIGLLPTGGGKSLTYQLSVLLQPTISFVVVPIKALMLDQIKNLASRHYITHANYINGDLSSEESSKRLNDFTQGKYFFLIISPERFQLKKFREELSFINRTKALSIAVIDEVHCLSEWGHEFRTSYLALANTIRKYVPSMRFLALTATASSKVLQDITSELEVASHNVITTSQFTRPELHFNIIPVQPSKRLELLFESLENHKQGASLIFTNTINGGNGCYTLHSHINRSRLGLESAFYSGSEPKGWNKGISFEEYKTKVQQDFSENKVDLMIATKAFGMGMDKENIRLVIHYGIPSSLESFYQEAGRAGRDKKTAHCLVLYSPDHLTQAQEQILFGLHTDVEAIQSVKGKFNGDLKSLLFFLTLNLKDVEEEIELIYDFYHKYLVHAEQEILVSYTNDTERKDMETNIYRLALLGIVDDWTIDWKTKKFEVVCTKWTEDSVVQKITQHINKYDYTFSLDQEGLSSIHADLVNYFNNKDIPFLKRILYVFLKWYNDNVIYSRKRSLLLMKEYADSFEDSDTFQRNIETYFKRNNDVYFLENVVGKPNRLKDWFKIFYVQEEGKTDSPRAKSTFKSLKIITGRFLESYQNDVALNLINGLINLVEDQFDSVDGKERLSLAIREVVRMDGDTREEMLQSILMTCDQLLSPDQSNEMSEVLIENGFNEMSELRKIHLTFNDQYSYNSMFRNLKHKFSHVAAGGYPWEA